ncbi:FAD-binding protein [Gammaproteobacteria bacterium AS21]
MSILVIAEHDNETLKSATLNTVTAALAIGADVDVLVAGHNCDGVAQQAAKIAGVKNVLVADNALYANQLAENMRALIVELAQGRTHILAPASTSGKNIMPGVAALLDVAQISEIISVQSADVFERPIYAGNAIAKVESFDAIKVLTVRTTAFDEAALTGSAALQVVDNVCDDGKSQFIGETVVESERPELTSAKIIISGGRGMGNGENFSLLEAVADKLGAAVGASRAAVDAGFVSNDMQVGQTGKIVAPDLYIAVGISGAIQHLAGMKDSKVIVAINKDEEAPIFSIADYGLVADLFDVVPQLEASL